MPTSEFMPGCTPAQERDLFAIGRAIYDCLSVLQTDWRNNGARKVGTFATLLVHQVAFAAKVSPDRLLELAQRFPSNFHRALIKDEDWVVSFRYPVMARGKMDVTNVHGSPIFPFR